MAAKRIAPFVRQTHLKDAYVELVDGGAHQKAVHCGAGLVDFSAVLQELNKYNPGLNLTFENDVPRSNGASSRASLILSSFTIQSGSQGIPTFRAKSSPPILNLCGATRNASEQERLNPGSS